MPTPGYIMLMGLLVKNQENESFLLPLWTGGANSKRTASV